MPEMTEQCVMIRPATDADCVVCELPALMNQLSRTTEPVLVSDCRAWRFQFVLEAGGVLIGSATLLIERKLIHNGGLVGYIEDVVVDAEHRRNGHGRSLVQYLADFARQFGCYKVILSCGEHNVAFYEACGFRRHEVTMRLDLEAA